MNCGILTELELHVYMVIFDAHVQNQGLSYLWDRK